MTPKLPPWGEPMLDAAGQMTKVWRAFFEQLVAQQQEHEERIEVLEP